MLGGRAIGAIIGIISACALFLLLIACGVVFYRRYLTTKRPSYAPTATRDEECPNEQFPRRSMENLRSDVETKFTDSPPPYAEAIRRSEDL